MRRKQETVRCFNTSCRKCGSPVLYWEGSAGSKVFFEYPVRGKLIKHHCKKKKKNKKIPYILKGHAEHSRFDVDRTSFQCPVCGKIFDKKNQLSSHIKRMEKTDNYHADFFTNAISLMNLKDEDKGNDFLDNFQRSQNLKKSDRIIIKKSKKKHK